MRIDRLARRPLDAVARSGRTVIDTEAERALDRALAGPVPETAVRALVEHRVAERVAAELLRANRVDGNGHDPLEQLAQDVAGRVLASQAFRDVLSEVLASPAVEAALSRRAEGLGEELAAAVRSRSAWWDDTIDARVHRVLHLAARPSSTRYGGVVTRGIGLVLDALLVQLAYLLGAGSVLAIAALAGGVRGGPLGGALAGVAWFVLVAVYFVAFWTMAGQTPGMRLAGVRVADGRGAAPSAGRSLVRLVGLLLAIAPAGAGFLPVLVDRRRRGLHDFLAGTVVTAVPNAPVALPPRWRGDAPTA